MNVQNVLNISEVVARPGGPGTPAVLNGLTLTVSRGEKVVLVGPSGTGKTTALRVAAGLLIPDHGEISFMGQSGYMPQHPLTSFDPRWSILQSVAEPAVLAGTMKRESIEQAENVLKSLQLTHADWHRRPYGLSGGQLRRAAIARALVTDPDLVLADEPTAGLDPEATLQLIDLFREYSGADGPGVLWVTHDLGVAAAISDRILVLEEGRIAESVTMEQLILSPQSVTAREMLNSWLPLDREMARSRIAG